MYNASKTIRVSSSYSQEEKANIRRTKLLIQLRRNSSPLMLESKTLPSTLLTESREILEKNQLSSLKNLLMLKSTESSVNCKLTRTTRARENSEQRQRLKRQLKNERVLV